MGKGGYLGGSTIIGPRSFGWFGTGSQKKSGSKPKTKKPHGQAHGQATPKQNAAPVTSNKKKRKPAHPPSPPRKGNGLTIPEQVNRARKKVRAIEAEVTKGKARLLKLERQLQDARKELERVQKQPRRSSVGQALAKALSEQQQQ